MKEETKRKISLAKKGKHPTLETRRKISETCKGKHRSPRTEFKKGMRLPRWWREEISDALRQQWKSGVRKFRSHPEKKVRTDKDELKRLYIDRKMSIDKIANLKNCGRTVIFNRLREFRIPIIRVELMRGRRLSPATEFTSELSRERWKNPEYRRWMMSEEMQRKKLKGLIKRPNKLEQKLGRIIQAHNLPFRYVGDGEFILGNKCPDFLNVNGAKQVIEVFGDYWHSKRVRGPDYTEEGVKELYERYGFDCLILWEHEINGLDEEEIAGRIRMFMGEDL